MEINGQVMRIAIYGRLTQDNISGHIQTLFNKLEELHAEILVYEPFLEFIKQTLAVPDSIKTYSSNPALSGKIDYMLSLGGDGTFLETLTYVRNSGIPILGINTGRLGFLAN